MNKLRRKLAKFPLTPGIYIMKGKKGEILYIGKAKSLKKRVQSYFLNRAELPKITILMTKVQDIDYVETPTEVDALLLEAHFIRKYQPRYNKELKDDKSFPLLKITHERFPRIHITRNKSDKRALYYGPYTDSKLLRQAVSLIHSLFPIRKCQRLPKTACLYYHIGQCLGPCIKPETEKKYQRLIEEVRGFLGGGKKSFVEYLSERMQISSKELRFEDAQFYKEQIEALGKLKRKKFIPARPEQGIALSATLELKQILKTMKVPEKIVCFDVSNIQGRDAVASKVSFYRELPDKLGYRRYRIKGVQAVNDYAMIKETLIRMLQGIKEGREDFIPDLIVIDGGKGHLNTALQALKKEGMENIELISIAKRFERIHSTRFKNEIILSSDSSALHLIQKLRDEAHRFAITYHRSLKEKGLQKSLLDDIPGIGLKRKKMLLRQFDSLDELKRSGLTQLATLPGMNRRLAEKILEFFQPHLKYLRIASFNRLPIARYNI